MSLAAVTVALLAVAPATASTTPTSNDPELEAMLLTIDDLPAGWTVDNSGTSSDDSEADGPDGTSASTDPCNSDVFDDVTGFADADDLPHAIVAFEGGGSRLEPNYLVQGVVDLGESGEDAIAEVAQFMTDCPTQTDDDATMTEYSPMSFPDLGDATIAYRFAPVGDDTSTVSGAYILTAVDERMTFLIGVGDGSDGALLEDLARTAVDRID